MARLTAILLLVAVASAWASAQPPIAGENAQLLRRNTAILSKLVDRALQSADANSPLTRAEACRRTAVELADELRQAVKNDDPDRVAELGEYLAVTVSDGLTPTLTAARTQIPIGSQAELDKLHEEAEAETNQAVESIPFVNKVGRSQLVSNARDKLAAASAKLAAARK